jgi:GTP cyclohydrolase I
MLEGLRAMLTVPEMNRCIAADHCKNTPWRFVKAMQEDFWGIFKNPAHELRTEFMQDGYDQIVSIAHVEFVSICAHHLRPFIGRYTFSYMPKDSIVGLSKIPRMIEVLCARPQVQEQLSAQIVDTFQQTVSPKGCGLVMDAFHTCMCTRGVKKWATTRTTALRGVFLESAVKGEFMLNVGPIKPLGV